MRHLLMDPAFPDIVGQWAAQQGENKACGCVNSNGDEGASRPSAPFLAILGKLKIAATRSW